MIPNNNNLEDDSIINDENNVKRNSIEITTATFLMYNVYRVYLMGDNSKKRPWAVSLEDIPILALAEQDS